MNQTQYRSEYPVSAEDLYAWHLRPGAFERISAPWQSVRVVQGSGRIAEGVRTELELKQGPLSRKWLVEYSEVVPGKSFTDRQVEGPFAEWVHTHRCEPLDGESSALVDQIAYALPLAALGQGIAGRWAETHLDRLFYYRHAILRMDLERFGTSQPGVGQCVLVSGHRGLIGSSLVPLLRTLGYTVRGLSRQQGEENTFHWNPDKGEIDAAAFEGVDAVIHLAGENIASGRWTEDRQKRILESREKGTGLIARELAKANPHAVLISASGVNIYPANGDPSAEDAASGEGFLSEVCRRWEAAAEPAREAGLRVVHPRFGVVLSPAGGALAKMLPAFLAGGGGAIGSGKQNFPWVSIEDVLGVLVEALIDDRYEGPVNVVSPQAVSQRSFASILGKVLNRPSVVPLPAVAVRTLFGKMGEETLLADVRPIPEKLQFWQYAWRLPDLESALRLILGRPAPGDIPRLQ